MKSSLLSAFLVVSVLVVPGLARAAGGIYVDDVAITNGSTPVLSDNFDDGSLNGWSSTDNATISSAHSHSPADSMHLNWHGSVVSEAFHRISITQPSVVEYSAWVYLPPVSEQYDWNHRVITFTDLVLYSGNTNANFAAGVKLYPGDSEYSVWMFGNNSGGSGPANSGTILPANTWAQVTLRMDNSSGSAYALLNGQQLLSITYSPQDFQSFNYASVWGWLGDGTPTPEPSSLMTLLGGVCALGSLAWRSRPSTRQ